MVYRTSDGQAKWSCVPQRAKHHTTHVEAQLPAEPVTRMTTPETAGAAAQQDGGRNLPAATQAPPGPTHSATAPLPPFSEMSDPATAAQRWRAWVGRLNHYFKGTRETDGTVKRSLLIFYGGAEIYDLFETLPNTGEDDDYEGAVNALNRHFDPQINHDFEKFKFRRAWQTDAESVDMFYARLRRLASTCPFTDQRAEIRDQIILGCRSQLLRKLILRTPGMSLDDILVLARSHELSDARAEEMGAALHTPVAAPTPLRQAAVKIEQVEAVGSRPAVP